MREDVIWTDLNPQEINEALAKKDLLVSLDTVRELLDHEGYRRRKILKYLDMGSHPDRDAQFHNIARIKSEYLDSGEPILSIDTKKKELLGTFYRDGRIYTRQELLAYDHDFPRLAEGVVIPYGFYDLRHNLGYVSVGSSRDTTEFACDSIGWWWREYGSRLYPSARSVFLLRVSRPAYEVNDGGGSNSSSKYIFKEDLQRLSDRLGREIRVAHDPRYCSKDNPVERRMFCHVTQACQGVLFDSVATVVRLIEKTRTAARLRVAVGVLDQVYQAGRTYTEGFKENMKILFDEFLPRWNYQAVLSTA